VMLVSYIMFIHSSVNAFCLDLVNKSHIFEVVFSQQTEQYTLFQQKRKVTVLCH